MKKVLIPLAQGFEEIEAVTLIDVLRRAGVTVITWSIDGDMVNGAHGLRVVADTIYGEIADQTFDAVILPGGMPGTTNLLESKELKDLLQRHATESRIIGAICAAPWVLSEAGVLDGKRATAYPGFEEHFSENTEFSDARIVDDGEVLTSRGPGTAMEFALYLVNRLVGEEKEKELRDAMLVG